MLYAFSHEKIECCFVCPLFQITWNEFLEWIEKGKHSGHCELEKEYVSDYRVRMNYCPLISEDEHGNFKLERV